jgi:hypothetical protein
MSTLARIVAGLLLIAHGLVHLLYLVPDVKQFRLEGSWLVPESASHSAGYALMAAIVAGFVLVGLAVWGVPFLSGAWPAIVIAASIASLTLLIAFWSPQLIFGVILDMGLIAVAAIRPGWTDQIG